MKYEPMNILIKVMLLHEEIDENNKVIGRHVGF